MEIKLFFLRHVSKMRMPFVNENDMNRDEGFIANFTFFHQEVLTWKQSRKFFYWRVRRLLLEKSVKEKLGQANK